jgi:Ca2+-binding EF-hand superfamily protein
VAVILFSYLFDVVVTGVMVTSVEGNRVRKAAEQVVRHQKEHNAVWLMSIIAVIINGDKEDHLELSEIEAMQAALVHDEEADRKGEPATAIASVITERLGEKGDTELIVARLLSIFDSVDEDQSGELSKDEIFTIFREIGFDSPEDVDASLEPMLRHIPKDLITKIPAAVPHALPPPSGGLCAPKIDKAPPPGPPPKPETTISKAIFLAWFLHLEKKAATQTAKHVAHTWFNLIDDDQSGVVSVVELQEVLQSCGKAFTADDVSALILELDTNGDGAFDHHEFEAWFARHMHK